MNAIDYYQSIRRYIVRVDNRLKAFLGRQDLVSVNPRQAMILAMMPDKPIRVRELREYSHVGTNPSYNVRKLVELGYLDERPDAQDRRARTLTRTASGDRIRMLVRGFFNRLDAEAVPPGLEPLTPSPALLPAPRRGSPLAAN